MAPKMRFPKAYKAAAKPVEDKEDEVPLAEILKKKRSARKLKSPMHASPEGAEVTPRLTRSSATTLTGTPLPTPILIKSSYLDRSGVEDLSGLDQFHKLDETDLVVADVLTDLRESSEVVKAKPVSRKGKEKVTEVEQEVATETSNPVETEAVAEIEGEQEEVEVTEAEESPEKGGTEVLGEEDMGAGSPVATGDATVELNIEANEAVAEDEAPEVESELQPIPPALQEVPPTESDLVPEEEETDVEIVSVRGRKRTRGDFGKVPEKSPAPVVAEASSSKRRKKTVAKKTREISQQEFDSHLFTGAKAVRQYELLSQKEISSERGVRVDKLTSSGIMPILEAAGLIKSLTDVPGYSKKLVLEFYANLKEEVDDEVSAHYHQAYVRGTWINFSPSSINAVLGLEDQAEDAIENDSVVTELTGGKYIHWVNESKLKCKDFTLKYAILHKLAMVNWLHTKQESAVNAQTAKFIYRVGTGKKFNLGALIFDRIQMMVSLKTERETLKYPNLIHRLCVANGIEVQEDLITSPGAPYSMSSKMMLDHHNDIETVATAEATRSSNSVILAVQKQIEEQRRMQNKYLQKAKAAQTRKRELMEILKALQTHDLPGPSTRAEEEATTETADTEESTE